MAIPVPKIEIAFSGTLETISVSSYVLGMRFAFGRRSYLDSVPVGTATIQLLNTDNRFHPLNTSGPYYYSGTGFDTYRPIRISATSGFTNQIWHGYVTHWGIDVSSSPTSSVAVLSADDMFGRLRRKIVAAGSRPAEHYSVRMSYLLETYGGILFGVGEEDSLYWRWMTLSAIQYEQQSLASLIETTDTASMATTWMLHVSSYGALALAPGGINTVTDGLHFVPHARTTAGEIPYARISTLEHSAHLYNQVSLSRAGGSIITVEDTTSVSRYGARPYTRTGLALISDTDVEAHAERFLAVHKSPVFGPSWVEIDMGKLDSGVAQAIFLELTMPYPYNSVGLSYYIQGNHHQPGGACRVTVGAYTFECVIEGVEHIISSTISWIIRYYLSPRIFYTAP